MAITPANQNSPNVAIPSATMAITPAKIYTKKKKKKKKTSNVV